jgi:hypothetical protein
MPIDFYVYLVYNEFEGNIALLQSKTYGGQTMENGTNSQTPSFTNKLVRLTAFIVEFLGEIFNEVQLDYWLDHKKELKKKLRETFSVSISVPDILQEERQKIEKFYAECFGIKTIGWDKAPVPVTDISGMKVLEYTPVQLTEDQIFEGYAKKFGKDSVWKAYESISKAIQTQQSRPTEDYCFLHKGGTEPDSEHLNKSYDDFSGDGNNYMVPREGMIAAMRYRFETGKMYDVKGLTRFHALDSDGNAMGMYRFFNGQFGIGRNNRGNRDSVSGPRQLVF